MWQIHPLPQNVRNSQVGDLVGFRKARTIFPAVVTRSFHGYTVGVKYTDFNGKICNHSAHILELKIIDYPEVNIGEEYWSNYSNTYQKVISIHYNTQVSFWYCRIPYEDGMGSISSKIVSIPMRDLMNKLRRNRENKQESKMALYIAVRGVSDLQSLSDALKHVDSMQERVIIENSYNALQFRLRNLISENPNESWTIFNATTIAEIDRPPVRFRSL